MNLLTIMLIALAIVALGGWGYGTFRVRPIPGPTATAAPVAWASPLGIIGLIAAIALIIVLVSG